MDLLKGVSAHLDQNVGVKPRHSVGGVVTSGRITKPPRKRPRVASAAGTSAELESLASRVKKSRLEGSDIRQSESEILADKKKGKAKAQLGDNVASTPDPNLSIKRPVSGIPMSARVESQYASTSNLDEETSPMDTVTGEISNTRIAPEGSGKRPPPQRTVSQIKMPPPPVPVTKTYGAGMSIGDSSRHKYTTLSSSHRLPEKNIPSSNPEPVPKLHPLLLQQQSQSQSKLSSTPPTSHSTPVPCSPASASLANKLKNYTNSQKRSITDSRVSINIAQTPTHAIPKPNFQPKAQQPQPIAPSSTPSASQSSRPPVLGMRRAHTLPSSGLGSSFGKSGPLPSKQKGFKPPLISASQPQPASQPVPQIIAAAPRAVVTPTSRGSTPISARQTNPQGTDMQLVHRGSTNCSTFSNNSIRPSYSITLSLPSSVTSCTSSGSSSEALSKSASATTSQHAPANLPDSSPLPEPSDGDGDSSFGDISFDMDALEETMKLYD